MTAADIPSDSDCSQPAVAWLVSLLRCPQSGGPLSAGTEPVSSSLTASTSPAAAAELESESSAVEDSQRTPERGGVRQVLRCETSGREYPVVRGIPRFVEQEHLASFSLQWNRYEVAHEAEDKATFEAKTGIPPAELAGLKVLDAGCGGGRYAKIAGEAGATVIGADHSTAVDRASRLCGHLPGVQFVQADLKHLPFPPASFDVVFSIGVMHHDADTRAVFDAVARMVKPGGRLAVWLYRRNQWWQEAINSAVRRRTVPMDPARLEKWCRLGAALGGVPLVRSTLNKLLNFSSHPHPENRLCDTFDWYAPVYQHHHTVDELCSWFREAGFTSLQVLPPEKTGRFYRWCYRRNLLIGSGVNVQGTRTEQALAGSVLPGSIVSGGEM